MNRRFLSIGSAIGLVIVLLAGCSSGGGSATPAFIHIEEGVEETAVALTATARANPTPTPGPSPTPTATSTPYAIPTNPPDFDGSTVITTVGRQALTLSDYQKHVRFDRYRLLYPVVKLAERNGVTRTLDLTRAENQYLVSLFTTLADSYSFGRQSRRLMVIDAVIEQEARRRGIEVDPNQFNAKLLSFLGLIVGEKGQMPPEFEERYAEFLQGLRTYAAMSEEEFRKIVRARTLYDQLEFVIGHEPGAVNISQQTRVGVQVRDIILSDYMTALLVAGRVRNGESLHDVAASLGFERPAQDWRVLRWGEQGITDEIRQAIYRAAPGEVIGPLPTGQSWYVAQVGTEVHDVPSPEDVDALRQQHFLNWIEGRMTDPTYVVDYENWLPYTPQEPLPRDVSPLLRDENFTLPENMPTYEELFGLSEPTPTAAVTPTDK